MMQHPLDIAMLFLKIAQPSIYHCQYTCRITFLFSHMHLPV